MLHDVIFCRWAHAPAIRDANQVDHEIFYFYLFAIVIGLCLTTFRAAGASLKLDILSKKYKQKQQKQ